MKIPNFALLAFAGILLPASTFAEEVNGVIKKDTVQTASKEVTNRNMLLNASSADQPRQINVGLPSSLSATIFEDGLPVSYSTWPDMPYFSWFGGTSYGKVAGLSLSEGALQYGAVGYIVDSYHKKSGDKFAGTVNYQLNNYGRQVFDATLSGPIAKGWGYMVSAHQIWDPGYAKLQAAQEQTRMQNYKAMVDKRFAEGRGYMSLLYQYCRYTGTGSSSAPFIYVGDGSVKKYNGFNFATDSYYGNEASSFSYLDVSDGKIKTKSWKDAGTTNNRQLTFHLNYTFRNGMNLDVSSKGKWGNVSMAMSAVSGIVDAGSTSGYYLADGSVYTGKVQNRWMMYVPGYERSWLTTAVLKGVSKNLRHQWRLGANIWYNRASVSQMNTIMAHTVENNPSELYSKNSSGILSDAFAYNPGSGEYYDGHENKYAVYASDDWTLSKKLWMSFGARLEYLGYSSRNAADEDGKTNTRTMGWWMGANGANGGLTRFTGDYINPSLAYNIRYTIAPGFGLLGEYVYVRQRPNLQDYAGEFNPITAPVNINMGRAGIFWNNKYMQLVSQVSMITQTNYKSRSVFYNTMSNGEEESKTIPITYNVKTVGWTTDFLLTPFKGFTFHGLLTLQKPTYQKFDLNVEFPSGATEDVNVSGNIVTAMSKVLVELDPSYSWGKWNAGLNFRYFSKQYINKTNTLYFNGHWESFGHLNYMLNKSVFFSLNVVNFLNQVGATGSISAADLVTNTSSYKNYLMSGSYLRPFEVSLSTTINF